MIRRLTSADLDEALAVVRSNEMFAVGQPMSAHYDAIAKGTQIRLQVDPHAVVLGNYDEIGLTRWAAFRPWDPEDGLAYTWHCQYALQGRPVPPMMVLMNAAEFVFTGLGLTTMYCYNNPSAEPGYKSWLTQLLEHPMSAYHSYTVEKLCDVYPGEFTSHTLLNKYVATVRLPVLVEIVKLTKQET